MSNFNARVGMVGVVSRKVAREQGLTRYYTGKPCKWGHVAERFVSTGGCVVCGRENARNWQAANHEKRRETSRNWYTANAEKSNEASRKWREANPEKYHALLKDWYERNPDKVRVNGHRRRARLLNAPGSHTAQDVRDIYSRQQGRCAYCRIEVGTNYHVDHIQPLAKGGSNNPENLQICCASCNLRKSAKLPEKFSKELERQSQGSQELPLSPPLEQEQE
jgi:5-methylcytosine-specific restriction endonuclease McrA